MLKTNEAEFDGMSQIGSVTRLVESCGVGRFGKKSEVNSVSCRRESKLIHFVKLVLMDH